MIKHNNAIFTELGWVKYKNKRFFPLNILGEEINNIINAIFTELGWVRYDKKGYFGERNKQHNRYTNLISWLT